MNANDNAKEIAADQAKWKVLETTEDIQVAITSRNIQHFGQAEVEQIPFFTSPLKEHINYTATSA